MEAPNGGICLLVVLSNGTVAKMVGVRGGKSYGTGLQDWLDKGWEITSLAPYPDKLSGDKADIPAVYVALKKP